jgi:hypothetical protein
MIMRLDDLSQDRFDRLNLRWVGAGDSRHAAYWRHDADGHGTLLYDLDADELRELEIMIGNAADDHEITDWLSERADEFLWEDDT